MSKKKTKSREPKRPEPQVIELTIPFLKASMEVYPEGSGFIAACGYSENYCDFTHGKLRGTVVFANGLNVAVGPVKGPNRHSISIPLEQIVNFAITQYKAEIKSKKKGT